MKSNTELRDTLVSALLHHLPQAELGSSVVLRGSLAEGRADAYSDIDLRWEVSDTFFSFIDQTVPRLLAAIRPIESLRSDPAFQHSAERRLFFVQFAEVSLFWRVDLEVFTASTQGTLDYDIHKPIARGIEWSWTYSALMNVVGSIKAFLRGKEEEAAGLLNRGFQRVGIPVPQVSLPEQMICLVKAVREMDSTLGYLADRVEQLHGQYKLSKKDHIHG